MGATTFGLALACSDCYVHSKEQAQGHDAFLPQTHI